MPKLSALVVPVNALNKPSTKKRHEYYLSYVRPERMKSKFYIEGYNA